MRLLKLPTILIFCLILHSCQNKQGDQLPPPNIIWITAEDISPMLGCYGDDFARTPNLNQLAKEGARFTNAFSNAPVCSPARATLVTGVYATSLGSQHLRSEIEKPSFIEGFPKYLREAGYYCTNNDKEDYNFVDNTIWDESSKTAHWKNRPKGKPFFSVFNLGITHQSQIFGSEEDFAKRIGNIERSKPENVPIPPYFFDTPEIRKAMARYYDNIHVMDKQVGQLLKELEEAGLAENTVIFFFADHGTGLPRSKRAAYDSGLQVPLIIKAPEKYQTMLGIKPNSVVDDLVAFVDFAPTMLSLLDLKIPEYMQGKVFLGKGKQSKNHVFGFSDRVDEAFETARAVRSKEYLYIRNYLPQYPLIQDNFYTDQSEVMRALRTAYQKQKIEGNLSDAQMAMWMPKRPVEELYHVASDPHQINNLLANNRELGEQEQSALKELRQAHKEWAIKTHDSGLMPEPAMHKVAGDSSIMQALANPKNFPVETVWEVSEANRLGDLAKIENYLKHVHPVVRYWAANAANNHADKFENRTSLQDLLDDEALYVQVAAAEALCTMGNCSAMEKVVDLLENGPPMIQLMAARTLELKFEQIPELHAKVKEINAQLDKQTEGRWYGYDLYAHWALNEAFRHLAGS